MWIASRLLLFWWWFRRTSPYISFTLSCIFQCLCIWILHICVLSDSHWWLRAWVKTGTKCLVLFNLGLTYLLFEDMMEFGGLLWSSHSYFVHSALTFGSNVSRSRSICTTSPCVSVWPFLQCSLHHFLQSELHNFQSHPDLQKKPSLPYEEEGVIVSYEFQPSLFWLLVLSIW